MPRRPGKGAAICFCVMMARTFSTAAAAESRAASAESKFALVVLPVVVNSRWRCSARSAFFKNSEIVLKVGLLHEIIDLEQRRSLGDVLARLDLYARPPRRRPASATSMPCTAWKLPMAGRRGVQVSSIASATATVAGGGAACRDELLDDLRFDDELEIAEPRAKSDQQQEDGGENDAALQDVTQTGSGTDRER